MDALFCEGRGQHTGACCLCALEQSTRLLAWPLTAARSSCLRPVKTRRRTRPRRSGILPAGPTQTQLEDFRSEPDQRGVVLRFQVRPAALITSSGVSGHDCGSPLVTRVTLGQVTG